MATRKHRLQRWSGGRCSAFFAGSFVRWGGKEVIGFPSVSSWCFHVGSCGERKGSGWGGRSHDQILKGLKGVGSAISWQQAEVTREGFLEEVGFS